MPTLLVVHHTVSPPLDEVLQSVLGGARDDAIEGVDVVTRAALSATAADVLAADGYLLGTPANLGYMSGALKHFFDTIYYPCLEETRGRPYRLWVHGNDDTTGAVAAVERITTGLGWEQAARPLTITGAVDRSVREAAHELGGTLAATLAD